MRELGKRERKESSVIAVIGVREKEVPLAFALLALSPFLNICLIQSFIVSYMNSHNNNKTIVSFRIYTIFFVSRESESYITPSHINICTLLLNIFL